MILEKINKHNFQKANNVYLAKSDTDNVLNNFTDPEKNYITQHTEDKKYINYFNRLKYHDIVIISDQEKTDCPLEKFRINGYETGKYANSHKLEQLTVISELENEETVAFLEGLMLGNYQFLKYFSDKKFNTLQSIKVYNTQITEEELNELSILVETNHLARNVINEPFSYLNSEKFAEIIKETAGKAGCSVEVFYKEQIAALKMGGLLSVNRGSKHSPTFSIVEWKPENAKNTQPIVLVGKGVVYDAGGYSLKPTKNSMDYMKCDMGGAGVVFASLTAIAKAKLPVHVIGLIPATDNLINEHAYVPGDVITMHNKKTVEVLNTDAEGRLILADALSYAKSYNPLLTIDLATLTGAAAFAIGKQAAVMMGTAEEKTFKKLNESGTQTCERLVQFPFWDDYKESIKSTIADIKNVGGSEAGAITAGKFLENFVDYPWVHIDIAGPTFVHSNYNYRGTGATGYGVRLLYQFIKQNFA